MHSAATVLFLATSAYVATMLDNLFAFASQLTFAPRDHFARLSWWQSAGTASLFAIAIALSGALTTFPLRWIGLLAAAPWFLAWRAWRHRSDDTIATPFHGGVTALVVAVTLGADNIAVWVPLVRAMSIPTLLGTVATFCALHLLFLALAWTLATHDEVRRLGARCSRLLTPWLYAAIGVVILLECHTMS